MYNPLNAPAHALRSLPVATALVLASGASLQAGSSEGGFAGGFRARGETVRPRPANPPGPPLPSDWS